MSARQFPVTPAALRPEEWKLFRNGDIPPQPHGNSLLPCHHNRPHLNSAFFANFFPPVDWVKFGRILTLVCSKFLISCYWAECKISFAATLRFCSRLSTPHCLFSDASVNILANKSFVKLQVESIQTHLLFCQFCMSCWNFRWHVWLWSVPPGELLLLLLLGFLSSSFQHIKCKMQKCKLNVQGVFSHWASP